MALIEPAGRPLGYRRKRPGWQAETNITSVQFSDTAPMDDHEQRARQRRLIRGATIAGVVAGGITILLVIIGLALGKDALWLAGAAVAPFAVMFLGFAGLMQWTVTTIDTGRSAESTTKRVFWVLGPIYLVGGGYLIIDDLVGGPLQLPVWLGVAVVLLGIGFIARAVGLLPPQHR